MRPPLRQDALKPDTISLETSSLAHDFASSATEGIRFRAEDSRALSPLGAPRLSPLLASLPPQPLPSSLPSLYPRPFPRLRLTPPSIVRLLLKWDIVRRFVDSPLVLESTSACRHGVAKFTRRWSARWSADKSATRWRVSTRRVSEPTRSALFKGAHNIGCDEDSARRVLVSMSDCARVATAPMRDIGLGWTRVRPLSVRRATKPARAPPTKFGDALRLRACWMTRADRRRGAVGPGRGAALLIKSLFGLPLSSSDQRLRMAMHGSVRCGYPIRTSPCPRRWETHGSTSPIQTLTANSCASAPGPSRSGGDARCMHRAVPRALDGAASLGLALHPAARPRSACRRMPLQASSAR